MRLRVARRLLGQDLDYLDKTLPEINALPELSRILRIHQELSKYSEIKKVFEQENIPHLATPIDNTINLVDKFLKAFSEWDSIKKQLEATNRDWVQAVKQRLKKPDLAHVFHSFEKLAEEINTVLIEKIMLLDNPVYLPDGLELNQDTVDAIFNKVNGKSAFGFSGILGKTKLKKKFNEIRVLNNSPRTQETWQHVHRHVLHHCRTKELMLRWNNIANEVQLSVFEMTEVNVAIKSAKEELEIYYLIKRCIELESFIIESAYSICPTWPHHHEMAESTDKLQEFRRILSLHWGYHDLSKAWIEKEKLQDIFANFTGRVSESIKEFINVSIGNSAVMESHLQQDWSRLIEELKRIHGLRSYFSDIREICQRIAESGGMRWSRSLAIEPLMTTVDYLLPDHWRQAWHLRRLSNYLNAVSQYDEFKKLTTRRSNVESLIAKTYQDIAAKRTWLKLTDNATPDIKAALQAFRAAIAKIGKGTGKRAIRYRRDAKEAAARVNKVIPCWIMSHNKISESLPPEFGCFDLVIIDEASQSDLTALPAILRANKLLIVGDDKQVSPEGIGLEEEKINNLMSKFLSNQVEIYKQQLSPERSLYDLCKVVFADDQIMLREHFRCVSPIIEYSKREFYNHELKPLRLPKKSERLDPPLIDVIVEDGFRKNKENPAEARFIVEEIKKICSDATMENRSIGVVSLLGNEQSREIWEMLECEIGPELISRHNIACGDAHTFQGKERDIIFLSMVVTRDNNKADSRETLAQRYNVAASRARDRMYLVRSIERDELSPSDKLRSRLIDHFSLPFGQDEARVEDLRELCESGFELEVYDVLTERGYKVTPQVKVGGFRIDMVVEGHNDARMAIECDGDKYHDSSKWEDDINRQRILERAGWKFWRCFASTFVMNRDGMISDLISSLKAQGINPIGSDGVVCSIHSEQRRVKALSNPQ